MEEGGSWNVHFTNKAYLVKLSTKGEGGQKSPKIGPRGVCMTPNFRPNMAAFCLINFM